jgi:hypothetical protein
MVLGETGSYKAALLASCYGFGLLLLGRELPSRSRQAGRVDIKTEEKNG